MNANQRGSRLFTGANNFEQPALLPHFEARLREQVLQSHIPPLSDCPFFHFISESPGWLGPRLLWHPGAPRLLVR